MNKSIDCAMCACAGYVLYRALVKTIIKGHNVRTSIAQAVILKMILER